MQRRAWLWVQTTLTPIIDSKGNVIKLITIDTDISKLKKAEKQIEMQRDEISKQRDLAYIQRDEILQQKKEITDSIHSFKKYWELKTGVIIETRLFIYLVINSKNWSLCF